MKTELGAATARWLDELSRAGWREVEVLEKRGRSRRFERGPEGESVALAEEAGWAVRAGDAARSFFVAGSGAPPERAPSVEPSLHPLALPDARPVPAFASPPGDAAPLSTESEAFALFAGIEREARRELPDSRLVAARLEEGTSETAIASSRGVSARARLRAAALRVEVASGGALAVVEIAERAAPALRPAAIARRAVDRLVASRGPGGDRARVSGDLVLAAPLAGRLVEALAPLLVGRVAEARLASWLGPGRRLAAERITIVDDGRFATGALASPIDGEGLPTGPALLVEAGRFVSPLLGWWEPGGQTAPGCARRASWRDLPRRAPTQLAIVPDPARAPAELVAGVAGGAYLIDAEGGVRLDPASGRFAVPVTGFVLESGRATAPLGRRWLTGEIATWLQGIVEVGRDLAFVAGDGLYGSPTLTARGLELASGARPL